METLISHEKQYVHYKKAVNGTGTGGPEPVGTGFGKNQRGTGGTGELEPVVTGPGIGKVETGWGLRPPHPPLAAPPHPETQG